MSVFDEFMEDVLKMEREGDEYMRSKNKMTNSQYIEVAEMWGWKRTGGRWKDHDNEIWEDENGCVVRYWDGVAMMDIEHCINSWQGLGRTVESMRKINYQFLAWGDSCGFCIKPIKSHPIIKMDYDYSIRNGTELIEATHLAALEAIKSELKQ